MVKSWESIPPDQKVKQLQLSMCETQTLTLPMGCLLQPILTEVEMADICGI